MCVKKKENIFSAEVMKLPTPTARSAETEDLDEQTHKQVHFNYVCSTKIVPFRGFSWDVATHTHPAEFQNTQIPQKGESEAKKKKLTKLGSLFHISLIQQQSD